MVNDRVEHVFVLHDEVFAANRTVILDACEWCNANIGFQKTSLIRELDWYVNMGDLYIVDDDHAFAFRMRWC